MTADPIRQPDDEEQPRPEDQPRPEEQLRPDHQDGAPVVPDSTGQPDAPSADESVTEAAAEPVPPAGESLSPEAAESAEAAAAVEADPNLDPNASEAEVAAADAQEVPTTAEAVATIDAASDAPAAAPTDAPAADKASRRDAVGRGVRQLVVVVIGVLLLVGGVALGNYIFQTSRPDTSATAGPGGGLVNPPAAAQEFIAALAVNDADAVRSSLDIEPHKDLMREMDIRDIQKIDKIEVLGTSADGPRSATEILMQYQRRDGIATAINLVILVDDGKIEGFR